MWSESSMSEAAAQRLAGFRDAQAHQVPSAAGQHHQTHRGWESEKCITSQALEKHILNMRYSSFTSSRITWPALTSACSGMLPRDTAGCRCDCWGNWAPTAPQPVPTQARRCSTVQGGHTVDAGYPALSTFTYCNKGFFSLYSIFFLTESGSFHQEVDSWRSSYLENQQR